MPIPVGFSPQDIVVGATGVVNINDFARVETAPPLRVLSPFGGNIAAFGPTSEKTNLGKSSLVGVAWSRPSLFLRGGYVEFFKSPQQPDFQMGTVYGQIEENRTNVTVRQDPVWTVSIPPTPEVENAEVIFVNSGVRPLPPGNYYRVVVNGGTLNFTGSINSASNQYWFTNGLVINSGSTVAFSGSGLRIFVGGELTLRSTLTSPGMILGYVGTSTAHLEGAVNGDLFLAPNADVEMKVGGSGHFFGKNITLFEGQVVRGTVLSQGASDFIRPTEQATNLGEFSPSGTFGQAEIASALLTPSLNSSCSEPRAFVSFHGPSLFHRTVATIGSPPALSAVPLPAPTPAPAGCIGTPLTGHDHNPFDRGVPPEPDPPLWTIQPGGRAFYSDAGAATDNLMTRLSGGRVVQAGFSVRYCEDSSAGLPRGAGCPAAQPTSGSACDYATTSGACIYAPSQCLCAPSCTPGGGPCASAGECCSSTCSGGSCSASSTAPGTWVCGPLNRIEAGVVGVRMSNNCGGSWTAGPFDAFALGDPVTNHTIDRPEIHADPFDNKLYVTGNVHNATGFQNVTASYQSIYAASTSGVTNASSLTFQEVHEAETRSTGFNVMTTVLDEQARLDTTPTTHGRYVHLATFGCDGVRPIFELDTPFGRRKWDIATDASGNPDPDPTTLCREVVKGQNGMPFAGTHAGPSIAGVSSVPPRVRVAYTGFTSDNREIINVYSITWRSAGGYSQAQRPVVVRELRLEQDFGHLLFPQLIAPDHLAGSDLRVDTPTVLRYTTVPVSGDTVSEEAMVLYSGIAGPRHVIATWSIAATFPGVPCADPTRNLIFECFAGDYRYGAFFRKSGGTLSYFTPWTGKSPSGNPFIVAHGATIDVTP